MLVVFIVGGIVSLIGAWFICPTMFPAKNVPVLKFHERQRLYDLADHFDRVCTQNNLRYWIMSGTLLGAVRHNDLIPWDDDIDVCMPEEDANELVGTPQFIREMEANGKYEVTTNVSIWRVVLREDRNVFLDIFRMNSEPTPTETTNEQGSLKWIPVSLRARLMWPNEYFVFNPHDLGQRIQFGPLQLCAPPTYSIEPYLSRQYGKDWCRARIMMGHQNKEQPFGCPSTIDFE